VREGVRALIDRHKDLSVVVSPPTLKARSPGPRTPAPHVLVTDIRMPPQFHARASTPPRRFASAIRARRGHPLAVRRPEYAVALLAEGSAGYGYLLKDHIAEGNQLIEAIRTVATGGTALDPSIVEALVRPVTSSGELSESEEALLALVAEGKPIKAIAVARGLPPEAIDAEVEAVFFKLAQGVSAGNQGAIQRLRLLHLAIVDREEQGETLSRLLPGGIAEKVRLEGRRIGETERVEVTVVMSDIRAYSAIASTPIRASSRPAQYPSRRMNQAILGEGGTVMQFVGDAVMRSLARQSPNPTTPIAPSRRPRACTRCKRRSMSAGWPRGCPNSGSASGCRPALRRRRCWDLKNASSTPWWATRSTSPTPPADGFGRRNRDERGHPARAQRARRDDSPGRATREGRDTPVIAFKILALKRPTINQQSNGHVMTPTGAQKEGEAV